MVGVAKRVDEIGKVLIVGLEMIVNNNAAFAVWRSSNAPTSDVIAPPSKAPTTLRRARPSNSNVLLLHSVGIGSSSVQIQTFVAKRFALIR
jgi:hypothetical protein